MTIAWVVGRGGLLGAALERALVRSGFATFVPPRAFPWSVPETLGAAIGEAVAAFAAHVGPDADWAVHWAAGTGTMGSTEASLLVETEAFAALLRAIEASTLDPARGRLALASSAGAIYAGANDPIIDENTVDRPTTPYARAKLAQEALAREAAARTGLTTLIGRISTLYGVGQATGKPQGLLTHVARCLVRNQPVQIFVPLDTIRDYIAADDAAALMAATLALVAPGTTAMKILASERPATISEIVAIFKRLARRPPRIVTSAAPLSAVYTRRIQFRSIVPPLQTRQSVSLLTGISDILVAERRRYVVASRPRSTG